MVPKSGTQLPNSRISLTDAEFGVLIGTALQDELGASRRASKTIMAWTGVSDHTARAWLHGRSSPSGLHLVELAARSRLVMATVLQLAGHSGISVLIDLRRLETDLTQALDAIHRLQSNGSGNG